MVDVVVGRFPPPLGGVTVFVQRKFDSLRDSGALKVDFSNRCWIFKLFQISLSGGSRYFLNSGNLFVLFVFYFFGLLSKTILYDHNSSRHMWKNSGLAIIYSYFVRRLKEVRVVHKHLIVGYEERGLAGKVSVESPFLSPDISRREDVVATYSDDVRHFMSESGFVKVVNAASKYNLNSEGREIYGVEATLDLIDQLAELGINVKFLIAGNVRGDFVPPRILERIDKLTRDGWLVLLEGNRELWPVLEVSDVFLRLTSTDGESVSVQEAIHFGCKVIASDVVPRPQTVNTYRYGDAKALLDTFLRVLHTD